MAGELQQPRATVRSRASAARRASCSDRSSPGDPRCRDRRSAEVRRSACRCCRQRAPLRARRRPVQLRRASDRTGATDESGYQSVDAYPSTEVPGHARHAVGRDAPGRRRATRRISSASADVTRSSASSDRIQSCDASAAAMFFWAAVTRPVPDDDAVGEPPARSPPCRRCCPSRRRRSRRPTAPTRGPRRCRPLRSW